MATKTRARRRKDAFAVLGDAIAASAEAMKNSVADARDAASHAVPAVRSALGKALYVGAYYASYGAVFAALAVGRLAPPINALGDAIHDGAAAAKSAADNGAVRSRSSSRRRARVRRPTGRAARRSHLA